MRAAVYRRFGPPEVLALEQVPDPVAGPKDVLVAVRATTVTSAEAAMRRGEPIWGRVILGFVRPRQRMRTLGIEFAGVVTHVGEAVREFAVGDEVFGFTGFAIGANAEILRMPAQGSIARKPVSVSFAEAAAVVDGASTALYFLRDKARLHAGQKVLVIGASGSIGTYAIQLARHFGAEVTGVCSTSNVELVTSLGAHHVVDYTRADFAAQGVRYDVIFDTVGRSHFRHCRAALTEHGCYMATTGLANYLWVAWTRLRGGPRVLAGMSVDKRAALPCIARLVENGELRIVIDRVYPLEEIVEAHRYVDSGRKRGNVVITLAPEPDLGERVDAPTGGASSPPPT
ncbi:MAG: NAD(P)-dependent alcohol dehydrogenase [Myxococcales bacterium]|nr:NAD(P)-dependent alcohol dehydrogenase [Myxococcales bacterium]